MNQQGVTVATPNVTIRTSDAFAAEERQRPGMLTVSRGASAVGDLAVMYSLAGTASDADYSLVPNAVHSVTIPDGSSEATIRVVPVDDTELEGNETVVVSLLDGSSYDLSIPNVASVNITDNEPGTPTHQISADRNPCELPSEGSCTTTITWNTSADNAFVPYRILVKEPRQASSRSEPQARSRRNGLTGASTSLHYTKERGLIRRTKRVLLL